MSTLSEVVAEFIRTCKLPEGFDTAYEAVPFFRELLRQGKKKKVRLTFHGDQDTEFSLRFLDYLDKARQKLTGDQFDEIWSYLKFTLDVGVWGGDPWQPKILPNGGLLIRNHHRVIALDEQPLVVLETTPSKLRKEVVKLYEKMAPTLDENAIFYFTVLHRTKEGFLWTGDVPEGPFSSCGQTLIFLPTGWLEAIQNERKAFPLLSHEKLRQAAQTSRSGHCVVRTFLNHTYGYSTHRSSDEYDILLEEFASAVEYEADPEVVGPIVVDNHQFDDEIKDRIANIPNDLLSNIGKIPYPINLMVEHGFKVGYAREKRYQIMEHPPIFGTLWDQPPTYTNTALYEMPLNKRHNLVVFQLTSVPVGFKGFERNLLKQIQKVLRGYDLTKAHLSFAGNGSRLYGFDETDTFPWDSEALSDQIKQVAKKLRKDFKSWLGDRGKGLSGEKLAEQESDFLYEADQNIWIFVEVDKPDPVFLDQEGRRISRELGRGLIVYYPSYGYEQSYSSGEVDTGNLQMFLPYEPRQLDSDDSVESDE